MQLKPYSPLRTYYRHHNITTISSKKAPHTLNHPRHHQLPLSPTSSKQVQETNKSSLLQPRHSQSNHHKYVFSMTTSKISCSLIEPLILPWVLACCCKFHALVVWRYPTFTIPYQLKVYLEPSRTSAMDLFLRKQLMS